MMGSLWVALLCAAPFQSVLDAPWLPDEAGLALRRRIDDATDGVARAAALREALDRGRLDDVLRGLPDDPAKAAPEVRAFFALVEGGAGFEPAEAAAFVPTPPPPASTLAPIDEARRRTLLKDRFRDIRLANKSTYFDLWSDLSGDDLQPYTELLNGYYRAFRNRFRADLSGNIDVFLFGNRADYLYSYARSFRESGESVLGYYVPALRRLVFYDDPTERAAISLVARHECTHLLVDLSFDGAPVPPWLNEGLACYLAADGAAAAGEYTAGLIRVVQAGLRERDATGLDALLRVPQKSFEYAHYAWAWSLVHFLNEGARESKFRDFLGDLRERLTPDMEPESARDAVLDAFDAAFGADHQQLTAEWHRFMEHDFRLQRDDQVLAWGESALRSGRSAKADAAARRDLAEAAWCFDAASRAEDADVRAAARLGRLDVLVAMEVRERVDVDRALVLLREVRDGVVGAPRVADEGRKARVVRGALDVARSAAVTGKASGTGEDLRAVLIGAEGAATGARRPRLRALVALHDELLGAAFSSLAAVLEVDPLDRSAAQDWLYLAAAHAPGRVREVFDHLQLLVDREPDDRNLAALGVAYHALGKGPYGRQLVEQAAATSLQPGLIEPARAAVGLR